MTTEKPGRSHRDQEEQEFDRAIAEGMRDVHEGVMGTPLLLRLARTRDEQAVQYCLRRLADPGLEGWEEQLLARILQKSAIVQDFVSSLRELDTECAEAFHRTFRRAEEGGETKLPVHLQSQDVSLVLRLLSLLEHVEESKGLFPFLFATLSLDSPQIQSKAALLIQGLDGELVYTRRLLQHPIPRVRANTLEALVRKNEARARDYFRRSTSDASSRVRVLAAVGLCRTGDPYGWELLTTLARHPNPAERRTAVWGLGFSGGPDQLRLLEELERNDSDERVRQLAFNARRRIANEQENSDRR